MADEQQTSQDGLARDKVALRTSMRAMLSAMPWAEVERASSSIVDHLARMPMPDGAVLAFLAMRPVGDRPPCPEPNLDPLIDVLRASGRRVALPAMDWLGRTMQAADVTGAGIDIRVLRYGVPEPIGAAALDPAELGAVLVPGLAFDASGGRLGRGAGFYDRFLATCREAGARPVTVGVCFARQVVEQVPMAAHDERVSCVVHEGGVVQAPPRA